MEGNSWDVKSMDKELEDFIERLPERKKGKLAKWEYAIFKLREVGATFTEISEFLKIKGVIAHTSEIHRFVHAKKRRLGKTKPVISPIQGKIEIENKGSLEIPGTVMAAGGAGSSDKPKKTSRTKRQ